MSTVIEPAPPTKRPDDPFVREMGDALWRIEGNYLRGGGSGPRARFEGRLLTDVQAEYVINKTRVHDARARFTLIARDVIRSVRVGDQDVLMRDYDVQRTNGDIVEVVATITADPREAGKLLGLLNRGVG